MTVSDPVIVRWEQFAEIFSRAHKPGEHVAIVGQTGSGKTVLGLSLADIVGARMSTDKRPARVVVFGTKPEDETLSTFQRRKKWPTIKKWPPAYGQEHCVVWPRGGDLESLPRRQRTVFRPLMNTIHREGRQTVEIDEASYFEDPLPEGLGLSTLMKQYWTSARSSKLTLIAGTQRPRHVTRSMWSEPSWFFIFAIDDDDDLTRVAQISGRNIRLQVIDVVQNLGPHEFLCVRKQRGTTGKQLYISKVG